MFLAPFAVCLCIEVFISCVLSAIKIVEVVIKRIRAILVTWESFVITRVINNFA